VANPRFEKIVTLLAPKPANEYLGSLFVNAACYIHPAWKVELAH
jgi:hypothetical protein